MRSRLLRSFITIALFMCVGLYGSAYARGGVVIRAFSAPPIPTVPVEENETIQMQRGSVGVPEQLLRDV